MDSSNSLGENPVAVLLDFNGTLFFDARFHVEAWSKIYRELCPQGKESIDPKKVCGPPNDLTLKKMAPWLSPEDCCYWSERKEALYREACRKSPENCHLVKGSESLLNWLRDEHIPFGLASASIIENIDFFFQQFGLERWFRRESVVYDDGTYNDKGQMHLELARRLSVPFHQSIVVEDSLSSIQLARKNRAGLVVAVSSNAPPEDLIPLGADYVIQDFTEFDRNWLKL